ncbi:MAG: aminotransferase class IV [Pseudobdellovibrionaceae bacterium]|nr:aminotransferase class IV [Bdellovibrionales bacterium]USN48406.1 MAG: aminotransferase class IV [Pseudobdellovibrionaceae bacterium]
MASVPVLSKSEATQKMMALTHDNQKNYLAMYSSWLGGIVKSPAFMWVPIDDHLVHRGDGVFEAFKVLNGNYFLLKEHLDRLERSSKAIQMELPMDRNSLVDVIKQVYAAAGPKDVLFRLYVSRGPGGFSTNPYECVASQIYIVATRYQPVVTEKYEKGVRVGRSDVPIKDGWMAKVKSCNYLPNVMMKKEAVDKGFDFTVSFTQEGLLGEGSTENIALVSEDDELLFPSFDHTLQGTTLKRLELLAAELVKSGELVAVREASISMQDIENAKEMMLIGTTLDVLPVVEFAGKAVGAGVVGPVARRCLDLLRKNIASS